MNETENYTINGNLTDNNTDDVPFLKSVSVEPAASFIMFQNTTVPWTISVNPQDDDTNAGDFSVKFVISDNKTDIDYSMNIKVLKKPPEVIFAPPTPPPPSVQQENVTEEVKGQEEIKGQTKKEPEAVPAEKKKDETPAEKK